MKIPAGLDHVIHEVTHMPAALAAINVRMADATPVRDGLRSPSLDSAGHQSGTHSDPTAAAALRPMDTEDPYVIASRLTRNLQALQRASRAVSIDLGLLGSPLPRMPRCDDCGRSSLATAMEGDSCASCARGKRRKLQKQLDATRELRRVGA